MKWLRIFLMGGIVSYRALFGWLSPWILIPSFLVTPIAQILLFAYIGRGAGAESDTFFVVGNSLQYSAIPCLFGMVNLIVGERRQQTLGLILASPAPRLALVLGRALPVILNGFLVSSCAFVVGSLILGLPLRASSMAPLAATIAITVFGCTGLALVNAALGLRFPEPAVLSNIIFGTSIIACGAEIPLHALPAWIADIGKWLPLTHGISAARVVVSGGALSKTSRLLGDELLLGAGYGIAGIAALYILERQSRKSATIELV